MYKKIVTEKVNRKEDEKEERRKPPLCVRHRVRRAFEFDVAGRLALLRSRRLLSGLLRLLLVLLLRIVGLREHGLRLLRELLLLAWELLLLGELLLLLRVVKCRRCTARLHVDDLSLRSDYWHDARRLRRI